MKSSYLDPKTKRDLLIVGSVVFAVVGLCSMCGIFGMIGALIPDSRKTNATFLSASPKPTLSPSPTPSPSPSVQTLKATPAPKVQKTPVPSPTPETSTIYDSSPSRPTRNKRATSTGRYITGPRGGCYYINSNGNKTYVDRSLCN